METLELVLTSLNNAKQRSTMGITWCVDHPLGMSSTESLKGHSAPTTSVVPMEGLSMTALSDR